MSEAKLRYGHVSAIQEGARLFYGENSEHQLTPCERITDPELRIGILSANNLLPQRFILVPKDRQPISLTDPTTGKMFRVTHPGKSAFLYFGEDPDRGVVIDLVKTQMKRERKRDDHLHLATVGQIEAAGWQAWWTPLPDRDNWPHVRLVANGTINDEKYTPNIEEAAALRNAFTKVL